MPAYCDSCLVFARFGLCKNAFLLPFRLLGVSFLLFWHFQQFVTPVFPQLPCVNSFSAAVAFTNPGATLLEIKKSFRNGGNALYDWSGDGASPRYCSWRGVLCDNVTFAVAAL